MAVITPTSSASGTTDADPYTTLHLSAISFLYPPSPPEIRRCACKATAPPAPTQDQSKHIRVYSTEPSPYVYNQGSFLVKETRFSTEKGWHAPSDDLVADDAAFGSPVASVGWWKEGGQGEEKAWETRVYYVGKAGKIRERINLSHFAPEPATESFEYPLQDPSNLVAPTPGWVLTPLDSAEGSDGEKFPSVAINPLVNSKLAAVRTEDGVIHVFYQSSDNSIRTFQRHPVNGWAILEDPVVAAEKVKPGTPLTVITGAWTELRLFYVKVGDVLGGAYVYESGSSWTPAEIPEISISATALITAVGWNWASPYFEIRLYSTDDKDELYEISYSRSSGGWAPLQRPVSTTTNPGPFTHTTRSGLPLSAVAGVIVDDSWVTKVFFHPRRLIGEWDVCAKVATYNGLPKYSQGAYERRQVEEQTRIKIKEDEERKAREKAEREAREEAERKLKEEEERRAEEERKAQKANELPNDVTLSNPIALVGSLSGATARVDDLYYKLESKFPITIYGHSSTTLYITDNGMICLDRGTNARDKREGQRLPHRDNIPDYSIFPLWGDLLIAEGKPHGIYYEFTGQAPSQVLEVEWYVTRYGQEDQYYHFKVRLEEAKPGVVAINYYDALDKGIKSTVGVQGPTGNQYLQYSYNEPKINPGLLVVLDTVNQTISSTI